MAAIELSKNKRVLQVIQHQNNPLAIKLKTNNTEVYSGFTSVDLLTYINSGSLTLFKGIEEVFLPEGSCFMTPKYADFKIQRHLNKKTEMFESYGMILPNAHLQQITLEPEIPVNKSCIEHVKIPFEKVQDIIAAIDQHFKHKNLFLDQEVKRLFKTFSKSLAQLPKATLMRNLYSRNDTFLAFMHAHLTDNINQDELAKKFGMSTSSFYRLAQKKLGMSPYKWLQDQRMHYARFQLQFTALPASKIYMDLGFEDLAHFSKAFKNKFGYNPSDTYDTVTIDIIS